MFPGHGAMIYRNEAGEVLGWDYPAEPEYDPDRYLSSWYDEDDNADPECPDECPVCGADLANEGWPIAHQHADTGEVCSYRWT